MSQQEEIDAAQRVTTFLQDPAIREAFKRAEDKAYSAFRSADTNEKRSQAWALSKALEELLLQLQVTVNTGTQAAIERKNAERKAQQQRRPESR